MKGSPVGQWLPAEPNSLVQLPGRSRRSHLVRVVRRHQHLPYRADHAESGGHIQFRQGVESILWSQGLGDAATTALVQRSSGNAFYLEELIRATAAGRGDAVPETVLAMAQVLG